MEKEGDIEHSVWKDTMEKLIQHVPDLEEKQVLKMSTLEVGFR